MDSEVSVRVKRNVIYTEIPRIVNAYSKFEYFCNKSEDFYNVPVNSGFNRNFIVNNICRCIFKNRQILCKYNLLDHSKNAMNFVKTLAKFEKLLKYTLTSLNC